jgi:hypothetical protein
MAAKWDYGHDLSDDKANDRFDDIFELRMGRDMMTKRASRCKLKSTRKAITAMKQADKKKNSNSVIVI